MQIDGRNVYISGGTSGIGLAVAEKFAALGANLFLFSVDEQAKLDEAVRAVERARKNDFQRVAAIRLDVVDPEAVERELRAAAESFGPPTGLVNSAGIGGAIYFDQLSYERFDATVKISLYGARNTVAALLPSMRTNGGGFIVNVASMSGLIGLVGYAAYSSAKFAMVGFSQALRSELKRDNIRVAALCPPQVETPLLAETDRYKPPEVKAINNNAGLLQASEVADALVRALDKDTFLIVPGKRGKLFYHFNRLFPRLRERMTDRLIRKVQKQQK